MKIIRNLPLSKKIIKPSSDFEYSYGIAPEIGFLLKFNEKLFLLSRIKYQILLPRKDKGEDDASKFLNFSVGLAYQFN